MSKQHYRLHTLAHSFLLMGLMTSYAVMADDADAERIVVTGSHIKRIDQETSSPIFVIDREAIKLSGARTLTELLQMSPYTGAGSFNESLTTGFTPGAAAFDLRGFGPERTLTLVNGRRRAIYPFGAGGTTAFVDFNSIPLASIKRIEILKDGASALYGSDAVAGVVNIITYDKYEGIELNVDANISQEGGGEEAATSLKYGGATTSSEWFFSVEAAKRNELLGEDRETTTSLRGELADTRANFSNIGSTLDRTTGVFTPDTNCSPNDVIPFPQNQNGITGNICAFDYAPESQLLPETDRYAVDASYSYHFDSFSLHAQINRVNVFSTSYANPAGTTPVLSQLEQNDTMLYVRRATEFGMPTIETDSTTDTATLSATGLIGEFDWETSVYTVRNKVDEDYAEGWMHFDQLVDLRTLVASGSVNLRDQINSSVIESHTSSFWHLGESKVDAFDLRASGPIVDTINGPIWVAAGIEHRKESFFDRSHEAIVSGDVVGLGASGAEGDRNVSAAYTEFAIPVFETLELSAAVRYDSYGDFGDTTNPKLGFSYRPTDSFLLRGSWGKGFRAPGLHQLFTEENRGTFGNVPYVQIGNQELEPETSESAVLGFLLAPTSGFELQLDFWATEIDNIVTDYLSSKGILGLLEECPTATNPSDVEVQGSFCDKLILRVSENGVDNPVVVDGFRINNMFLNLAGLRGTGADLAVRFEFDDVFGGKLKWQTEVAFIKTLEEKDFPADSYEEYQGTRGTPRHRSTTSLIWNGEHITHALIAHVVGSWDVSKTSDLEVERYTQWDYQFGADIASTSRLTFGIKNLTDEQAPFSLSIWPYFSRNLYSAMGRTFTLGWQMNF